GTGIEPLPYHRLILHLADQPCAGGFDLRYERRRIAEGQHDRGRLCGERDIEKLGLFGETPGDEANAERSTQLGKLRGLPFKPRPLAIAATQDTEPARA